MCNSVDIDGIRTELEKRFDPDPAILEAVVEQIERAQQMEDLSDYSHWREPTKLGDDLESFSRGYGLQAGWNTWIGIQKTDTSNLTIDEEE
ncbi:hypothetical protein HTZ84_03050 [Haloterrigena sp. SYSU A558-1]|uniref:Uncharacterized protein n=1 Tax=Haloterrigena gelatinilytica TaxID=2741724 RepID=A0A8J8GPD6_9EURY|nr:hypothetical protein [Haloterrigena gelatinilytica]NUB92790.1 hypothetical protein [Haloterrigena gelatinilytica]NUC71296.1 hypothetical protein [Haloterrigena gelatinilytica]